LAAIVEQNPLLAVSVMEAALHVLPSYSGTAAAAAASSSSDRLQTGSHWCVEAAVALPIMAEATAARAAAATAASRANSSSDSSKLEQKMFCLLVAAVKYVQVTANLTRSARPHEPEVLRCYFHSTTLLVAITRAAMRVLGDAEDVAAGGSQLSAEQQLLWFQVLGRVVIAAGQLLQQTPQFISGGGGLVHVDDMYPAPKLFSLYCGVVATLGLAVMSMQSMLQQGMAAAAAVAAGSPAAAATFNDLAQLQQQADGLQMQVAPLTRAFCMGSQEMYGGDVSAALHELQAACQQGGLPQQLHSFGAACCAAFPTRGCCGNPACTNLDKFSEAALASQGCSGCHKVRTVQYQYQRRLIVTYTASNTLILMRVAA
jgi:hypothetical protein